jgi:hypothetical protein
MNKITSAVILLGITASLELQGAGISSIQRPVYVGINGGFGSTTWGFLVPLDGKQNSALSISTPVRASEGGGVYGGFAGYELTRYFAIEAGYRCYPNAKLTYDSFSVYAFDHNGKISFETATDTLNLMAKVMLTLPQTQVRLFSSFGVAGVHRFDEIKQKWRATPSFGAGLNADLNERLIIEIGFNYTAGYGESELNPANSYIPFLYSATLGLGFRI